MARIFGREAPPQLEKLAAAVRQMLEGEVGAERHVAQNLLNDDRISEERAAEFVRITGFPDRTTLAEALTDYANRYVSQNANATYLAESNSTNFIRPVANDQELAHVLNVRSLLQWAASSPSVEFDGASVSAAEEALTSTDLADHQRYRIIDELLKAYAVRLNERPIWAASWMLFEQHIETKNPASWNQCVGIWRDREAMQMVLRYSVKLVPHLLRPTQLESGHNGYHHPSPGRLASAKGGFALNLHPPDKPFPGLVCEFIHPPIHFDHTHWLAAGGMCGSVKDGHMDYLKLNEFRQFHREHMARDFPDGCKGWWRDSDK